MTDARPAKRTCIIFDVDGTLVDSNELDGRLYTAAIRAVLGDVTIRPNWADYEHVTDSGILRELCADNSIDPAGCERRVRACFGEMVSGHLTQVGACVPVRGAAALLAALHGNPEFELGIATGGWGHTARLKLASAGHTTTAIPLKSSDDHHERVGIMALCRNELKSDGPTIYVGDAEWDREASRRLGWAFIGVGESLRGRCARWVADFSGIDVLKSFRVIAA